MSMLTYVFATLGGIRASANLHSPMVAALLRCKMVFLETTPVGRILNRFTGVNHPFTKFKIVLRT